MEDNKPTYEEVESELNEYKELLWQLSDEYKENVTAAEKKVAEEQNKRLLLEKELGEGKTAGGSSDISMLGMPACVLDKNGKIIRYNNKFKFLIELLFFDIEEVQNIQGLLKKDKTKDLLQSISEYLQGDKGLYQSMYTVENSFQGMINLILRIYRNDSSKEHMALFVELHQRELNSIKKGESQKTDVVPVKKQVEVKDTKAKENQLLKDIKSFVKRAEISTQLLDFITKKINDKTENISLIREIYNKTEKVFNLKNEGKDLISKLSVKHKDFVVRLKKQHASLTENEVKQCILIKASLTYKEIAAMMDISVNGVKIARNRLRKKLVLGTDTKTSEFIMKI